MPHSPFATVTIRFETLERVKRSLLEQAMADIEEYGALAIWALRPSVSKFVEQAIKEKLERTRNKTVPLSPTEVLTQGGVGA